jgi:hypothetical protein
MVRGKGESKKVKGKRQKLRDLRLCVFLFAFAQLFGVTVPSSVNCMA